MHSNFKMAQNVKETILGHFECISSHVAYLCHSSFRPFWSIPRMRFLDGIYLNVVPFGLHLSNRSPNNRDQQTCKRIHDTKNILTSGEPWFIGGTLCPHSFRFWPSFPGLSSSISVYGASAHRQERILAIFAGMGSLEQNGQSQAPSGISTCGGLRHFRWYARGQYSQSINSPASLQNSQLSLGIKINWNKVPNRTQLRQFIGAPN